MAIQDRFLAIFHSWHPRRLGIFMGASCDEHSAGVGHAILRHLSRILGIPTLIVNPPAFSSMSRHPLASFLALIAVIVGSLVRLEQWFPDYLVGDITNALHFPSGVLLASIIGHSVRHSRKRMWAIWFSALSLFALIEIVQPIFDRSCTFSDWAQSSIGMTLGLLFAQISPRTPWYGKWGLIGLAGMLTVSFSLPLIHKLQTIEAHAARFPDLFAFENDREILLWKRYGGSTLLLLPHEKTSAHIPLTNQHFARVHYGDTHYPAIAYVAVERDWREYKRFCFDSRGDRHGQILRFKLRDMRAKGQDVDLRWQFDNPPHWHRICVSLEGLRRKTGEPFDLSSVYSLHMIGAKHSEERWFDIDNVRLER